MKDIIVRVDEQHRWRGNILQKIAEEVVRYATPTEDIIKNDLSEKLLKEIERQIKNKETLSLQINSKPRLGKSTLAILLGMYVLEMLIKCGMRKKGERFTMGNIARDQNERIKKMRNPNLMYDIIVTDESNALEDTGENATVEKAQREVFSDVQAGRYVHGIWVCPDGTMDKNCDIKLEIRNKDRGLIHTRVYYHIKSSFYYGWVLIGIADFDVRGLIKKWISLEEVFFRYLKYKKPEDEKILVYWSKRNVYVEYMCKKYEKMELMNREGILHARDLDYAKMRRKIINSLKPLAELSLISMQRLKNNIKSKIEIEFRKEKMPVSILGKELEYERVLGILEMYRSKVEIENSVMSIKKKMKMGKISEFEFTKTIMLLGKAKLEIEQEIGVIEKQLDKFEKLNESYNDHLRF